MQRLPPVRDDQTLVSRSVATPSGSHDPGHHRLQRIDVLRGIALVAMAVYHFAWDLRFFDLIETDIVQHAFWKWLARCIAASFLALSGISLVLASRNGVNLKAFWKRLATISGAAALITVITYFATPDSYIFFGILHCIALSSLLGLVFLRLPTHLMAFSAAVFLLLPLVVAMPQLNHPLLRWIGMGTTLPTTNDYNPLFPWFGCFLVGMVIGRLFLMNKKPDTTAPFQPTRSAHLLATAGRHSLLVYLVHQPVSLALVAALALILPSTNADRLTTEFRQACEQSCMGNGADAVFCPRYCACSEEAIRKEDLWTAMLTNRLTPLQTTRVTVLSQQCSAANRQ